MSTPINYRQLGDELRERLLAGTSATVTSEIAETFLPLIANALKKRFRNLNDEHLIYTAVEDALIDYLDNPMRFDPRRGGLVKIFGNNPQ
jgi:hypothetical protein